MNYYPAFYPLYNQRLLTQSTYILDFKQGDVNADGIADSVYLVGHKTGPDEIYADNIFVIIKDGRTNSTSRIPLANAGGYNAQLFLGHFTSKQKDDMLVSIDTGGSGRYIAAYLYTIQQNRPILLLDSDSFERNSMYTATFENNFKVAVTNEYGNKTFIIDVSSKRKMYIDAGIYNEFGKLLKPTVGGVLALGALFPLVNDYNGLYQLLAYQRIIGIYNADNLGAVQTYLKWNGKKLDVDRVEVSIMEA